MRWNERLPVDADGAPVEMRRALIKSVFLDLHGDWETESNENGCAGRRDRSDYGRAPEHVLRLGQRQRSGKPPTASSRGTFGNTGAWRRSAVTRQNHLVTLRNVIGRLEEFSADETIYAESPTPAARAVVA